MSLKLLICLLTKGGDTSFRKTIFSMATHRDANKIDHNHTSLSTCSHDRRLNSGYRCPQTSEIALRNPTTLTAHNSLSIPSLFFNLFLQRSHLTNLFLFTVTLYSYRRMDTSHVRLPRADLYIKHHFTLSGTSESQEPSSPVEAVSRSDGEDLIREKLLKDYPVSSMFTCLPDTASKQS